MFLSFVLSAQSLTPFVIGSSGGHYSNGNVILSFTVGEPVIETVESGDFILTQGFQQPELTIVGVREHERAAQFNVRAFPNPTMGKVYIEVTSESNSTIRLELYDAIGKLVQQPLSADLINDKHVFELDLTRYATGVYFVRLMNKEGLMKDVMRIQKLR